MTDWALELAENPNTYMPLRSGHERIVTDRYVLWLGGGDHPAWNVAQRFRFSAGELSEVREEIHARMRARGCTACSWEVGSSATPTDLVDRLLGLGLVEDNEPLRVGMALTTPPSGVPDVEVRRAETDDERRLAETIAATVYGTPFRKPSPPDPSTVIYLAYLDGKPIGQGNRLVQRAWRHALRRRRPDGGARPWRLSRARARPLGGRRCPRDAAGSDRRRKPVAPDPRADGLP